MVGGKVYAINKHLEYVSITVEDDDLLTVDVLKCEDSLSIQLGDFVWWQGNSIYWTPANREFEDRPISKFGFSHKLPLG